MPNDTHTTVDGSNQQNITTTVADAQSSNANVENPPVTPESLGVSQHQFDKYFNAEKGYDWQSHAREAEWMAKQRGDTPPADTPPVADPPPATTPNDAEAQKAVADAGLDWQALGEKIATERDLSPEDYAAIVATGVPEAIIRDYVKSLNSQADMHFENVQNAFGGPQGFEAMRTWAQGTFTEAEMDQITNQISNPETSKVAIENLKARYERDSGTAGLVNTPNSNTRADTNVQGYASEAEMLGAMRDPRYRRDPTYRQSVEAKVAASSWGGNPRAHSM